MRFLALVHQNLVCPISNTFVILFHKWIYGWYFFHAYVQTSLLLFSISKNLSSIFAWIQRWSLCPEFALIQIRIHWSLSLACTLHSPWESSLCFCLVWFLFGCRSCCFTILRVRKGFLSHPYHNMVSPISFHWMSGPCNGASVSSTFVSSTWPVKSAPSLLHILAVSFLLCPDNIHSCACHVASSFSLHTCFINAPNRDTCILIPAFIMVCFALFKIYWKFLEWLDILYVFRSI